MALTAAELVKADQEHPDIDGFGKWKRQKEKKERAHKEYGPTVKVMVYYIPAFDHERNEDVFFYAVTKETLHEKMMASLHEGELPHFAVVIAKGNGKPSRELKDFIKEMYGFDHDKYAAMR